MPRRKRVERAERGAAIVGRRGVGDEQSWRGCLRVKPMCSPQARCRRATAARNHSPSSQQHVREQQHRHAPGQQAAARHRVGQLPRRIRAQRIHHAHHHQHGRDPRRRHAAFRTRGNTRNASLKRASPISRRARYAPERGAEERRPSRAQRQAPRLARGQSAGSGTRNSSKDRNDARQHREPQHLADVVGENATSARSPAAGRAPRRWCPSTGAGRTPRRDFRRDQVADPSRRAAPPRMLPAETVR